MEAKYSAFGASINKADFEKIDVAALYDEFQKGYEEAFAGLPGQHTLNQWLLNRLSSGQAKILEVGSATGQPTSKMFADAGHDILGVDISSGMVELAREQVPRARFEQADIRQWSPPDGTTYDAIVTYFVLPHFPEDDYRGTIARLASWLKPGGYLCWGAVLDSEITSSLSWKGVWMGYNLVGTTLTPAENKQLLIENGFDVLEDSTAWFQPNDAKSPRAKGAAKEYHQFLGARKKVE